MPEEYTFLLNKSYSRESRTDFPGKWEWQNRRDPGKSGTGNPGNETLLAYRGANMALVEHSFHTSTTVALWVSPAWSELPTHFDRIFGFAARWRQLGYKWHFQYTKQN
jgi:hypothetical protein